MLPTAISQLIEALGKLIFGVWFASIAVQKGMELPKIAACAILGLSLGTLLSALYLCLEKVIFRDRSKYPCERLDVSDRGDGISTLLRIAIPITLSSAVLGVTRLVDMAFILRRLQDIGYSVSKANEIYGAYTTLAVPVFSLIPSLIAPISMALVPKLSAAIERRSTEEQAELSDRSIRLTSLLAVPASMGVAVYAKPILLLLFANEASAVELAAPLLSVLGISILFSGLITTTNAVLQSYRQAGKPMISMSIGALVKMLFAYFLIGIPSVGIYGAPISTLLCDLTITLINLSFLGGAIPKSKRSGGVWQVYYKPLAAALLAILASLTVYLPIVKYKNQDTVALLLAMIVATIVYLIFGILFKMITTEDIALLPMGEKILLHRHLFYHKEKRKGKKEL